MVPPVRSACTVPIPRPSAQKFLETHAECVLVIRAQVAEEKFILSQEHLTGPDTETLQLRPSSPREHVNASNKNASLKNQRFKSKYPKTVNHSKKAVSEWWFNAVSATEAIFTARTCEKKGNSQTFKQLIKVSIVQVPSRSLKSLLANATVMVWFIGV